MKQEIDHQFTAVEETANDEQVIHVPQGSVASDVQQAEDLSDDGRNSTVEQVDDAQAVVDEINQLQIDPAEEADEVTRW